MEHEANSAVDMFFDRMQHAFAGLDEFLPTTYGAVETAAMRHNRHINVFPDTKQQVCKALSTVLASLVIRPNSTVSHTLEVTLAQGLDRVEQSLDDPALVAREWRTLTELLDLELFARVADFVQRCQDMALPPVVVNLLGSHGPRLTAATLFEDLLENEAPSACGAPMLGMLFVARRKVTCLQSKLMRMSHSLCSGMQNTACCSLPEQRAGSSIERWFARLNQNLNGLIAGGDAYSVLFFVRVFVDFCTADIHFLHRLRDYGLGLTALVDTELVRLIQHSSQACLPALMADVRLRTLQIHSLGELERLLPARGVYRSSSLTIPNHMNFSFSFGAAPI